MKKLLLLFMLLPLFSFAQMFEYEGSQVEFIDMKGDARQTTTGKTGFVYFTDSTVIYVEDAGDYCHKEYSDTMKVVIVAQAANESVSYLISPTEYFIKSETRVLHVKEVGYLWHYETLIRKEN